MKVLVADVGISSWRLPVVPGNVRKKPHEADVRSIAAG
jgi:hypothetical protein